jgi:hypothetical protein
MVYAYRSITYVTLRLGTVLEVSVSSSCTGICVQILATNSYSPHRR